MTKDDLIIYLEIDEDDMYSGMSAVGFVDQPATEIVWNNFSKQKETLAIDWNNFSKEKGKGFKFAGEGDKKKRVVTGPIMVAETPIERYSKELGKYYVKFSEDTIFKMAKKYFKENKIHNVNENHDSKRTVKDVYLIESFFISDRVTSELYPELPMGSWMGSYFIEDEDYFNDIILSDKFQGFSLEGGFIENYEMAKVEQLFNSIKSIANSNLGELTKERKIKKLLQIKNK